MSTKALLEWLNCADTKAAVIDMYEAISHIPPAETLLINATCYIEAAATMYGVSNAQRDAISKDIASQLKVIVLTNRLKGDVPPPSHKLAVDTVDTPQGERLPLYKLLVSVMKDEDTVI